MIVVANAVGRLLSVRMQSPVTAEEVTRMTQQITAIMAPMSSRFIGVTDLRRSGLLPVELTEQIVALLRRNTPKVERAGFLISDGALAVLQLERVIRESNSSARRAFRERVELEAWLGEIMTPLEKLELRQFLAAHDDELLAPTSIRAPVGEAGPALKRSNGRLGA